MRSLPFILFVLLVAACDPEEELPSLPIDAAGLDGSVDGGVSDAQVDSADVESLRLRIASWNIENFPKHARTAEHVRRLIEAEELDLVGVQEIDDIEAFEALAASLPEHGFYYTFDRWAYTRVGFLYRQSLFEVGEVERLFSRETFAFPRDPIAAEIRVKGTDFDFLFVVVHLKAQVDERSRMRRAAGIARLGEWIRMEQETEPEIIVVGDFNDSLQDPESENVFTPLLEDGHVFLSGTENSPELAGDYSYVPFRAMIDHIMVTRETMDEYGGGRTYIHSPDLDDPAYLDIVSDHRPVISEFRLSP